MNLKLLFLFLIVLVGSSCRQSRNAQIRKLIFQAQTSKVRSADSLFIYDDSSFELKRQGLILGNTLRGTVAVKNDTIFFCDKNDKSKHIAVIHDCDLHFINEKNIGIYYITLNKIYGYPFSRNVSNLPPEKEETVRHDSAHKCYHTDLMNDLDVETDIRRIVYWPKDNDALEDSFLVKVNFYNKETKNWMQTIKFGAIHFYSDAYFDCKAVRSYSTGKNKNAMIYDYDFGDVVVADLNFDSKEDIAIKYDSGGNGSPVYRFYLQNEDGKFVFNRYMTDSIGSFPYLILPENKLLITKIHHSSESEFKTTFKYNEKTRKWKKIEAKVVQWDEK